MAWKLLLKDTEWDYLCGWVHGYQLYSPVQLSFFKIDHDSSGFLKLTQYKKSKIMYRGQNHTYQLFLDFLLAKKSSWSDHWQQNLLGLIWLHPYCNRKNTFFWVMFTIIFLEILWFIITCFFTAQNDFVIKDFLLHGHNIYAWPPVLWVNGHMEECMHQSMQATRDLINLQFVVPSTWQSETLETSMLFIYSARILFLLENIIKSSGLRLHRTVLDLPSHYQASFHICIKIHMHIANLE